jgi:pimeloyl-ACP methyl ester carboxylesterase
MTRYRIDIEAARRRLAAREHHSIQTPYGSVQYAERGQGPPVLFSHPLVGGFDVGLGCAGTWIGDGFRVIAPSRFGYLGSSLPQGVLPARPTPTPCCAYALLLDALGIERAVVAGFSAGGPSVIQFALRHPDRTSGLILFGSALPGKAGGPPRPVAPLLFTDPMFWTLKAYLPTLFLRCLGMPKGFRPTPEQWTGILESEESLFPLAPRKHGLLFDQYVSNPDVQGYPLEQLSVPTLIVNARDDGLSAFENAASAAERIPGAELLAIDHGGHMLLGSEGLIVREVARFLTGSRVG